MATPPSKVALVIANSQYLSPKAPPLPNPVSDGRLMARTLTSIGFQVTVVENAKKSVMEEALRSFSAQAADAQVAMIYYAGHGVEINHVNYLIPIDATIERDVTVELETVKLDTMMQMSSGAKRLSIVIIDACRNNPFLAGMKRSISTRAAGGSGLAPPDEPGGESLVVYSAKAGATALDGAGTNSPFASAVSRRLVEPGREINLLFRQVRDDVLRATDGQQEPFTYGSLSSQEFYFVPASNTRVAAPLDMENETWTLCRDGGSRGPCDAYLSSFPRGRFAGLAGMRLTDLALRPASASPSVAATAPSQAAAQVVVASVGITMQDGGVDRAVRVRSIDPSGLAAGEVFVGDEILSVNTTKINGAQAAASQIADAMTQGRVKLLIKRGPTTTVVVLRQE